MTYFNPSIGKNHVSSEENLQINDTSSKHKESHVNGVSLNSLGKSALISKEGLAQYEINDIADCVNEEAIDIAMDVDHLSGFAFELDIDEKSSQLEEEGIQAKDKGTQGKVEGTEEKAIVEFDRVEFLSMLEDSSRSLENAFIIDIVDGKVKLSSAKDNPQRAEQAKNAHLLASRFNNRLVLDSFLIDSGAIKLRDGKIDYIDEKGNEVTILVVTFKPRELDALALIIRKYINSQTDPLAELHREARKHEEDEDKKFIAENRVTSHLTPANVTEKQVESAETITSGVHASIDEKANREKWAKQEDEKASERTRGAIRHEIHKKDIQNGKE